MEIPLTLLVLLCAILPLVATHEISAVYAWEGGSAIFDKVQRNLITEFDDIGFKMNASYNIMSFIHLGNDLITENEYKGRLIFNTNTFRLELKNLQKNDSGLYECKIRWNENITTVMYELFVLEPVAAPILTVVSNWSSSDCNVTVTCRGHDLSLTISCNRSDCTQLGDLSITPTLAVFVKDGHIICNHSNQVSWQNVTLDKSSLCEFGHEEDDNLWNQLTVGLIASAGIVAAFVLMCTCLNKKMTSTGAVFNSYASIRFSRRLVAPERTPASSREQDERAKAMNNRTPEPQPEPVIYSLLQPARTEVNYH